jgi:tetratricopeptide (TPR) repeat protein
MPSHTWNEVGRWGDSVRANIQAWHSDLKAKIDQGFAIYPQHNLHMLLYAASMDGQGAIATQAGKDYTKLMGTNMYEVLTLVRFGRFDEIARITERPKPVIDAGVWDFAQGYARLRTGEIEFARPFLSRLQAGSKMEGAFRNHSAAHLLGTLVGILEGEIHRADGKLDAAITSFQQATALEDLMIYDEPEPLPFAARHWLGAALLEARRYSDAERVYREELEDHPHNGWSLLGLKAALDAQSKPSGDVDADFNASWSRSDTWIRESRF